MNPIIERAVSNDRPAMTALLERCGLSSHGVLFPTAMYWVCREGDVLVGTCGMEVGAGCALLRSVCVSDSQRGKNIAKQLIQSALIEAAHIGLSDIYLFSKDTGGYFERMGWRPVSVAEVRARLPEAPQVLRYEQIGWYPDERAFLRTITVPEDRSENGS